MLTYFDVVEYLITASSGGPQDAEQRDIRTAVQRSYQELTTVRDWMYYSTHGRIITQAPATATVSTYAAGVLTVSAPMASTDWSHVRAGDIVSQIAKSVSSTVFNLDDTVRFNTVAPGTTVTFYKSTYPLPDDFRNLDEPSDELHWWAGRYVTPDEAMKLERVANPTGSPYRWTILKDPLTYGWSIVLVGYPTRSETIDFTYRRTPRKLKYSGHEAGSRAGTISSASTAVTGTATAFVAGFVGSVLRVGSTTLPPEPLEGISPYAAESLITAFSSTTSLTTASAVSASAMYYLITDPLDLPTHMHTAMFSAAEYWLTRIRGGKADAIGGFYQRDLRLAMEQDQLAPLSGRTSAVWSDGGWRSSLKVDGGT